MKNLEYHKKMQQDPSMKTRVISAFRPDDYTQVLFAYSLDTYLNTEHPAKAGELGGGAG